MRRTLRQGAAVNAVTFLCASAFSPTLTAQTLMQANISAAMARKIVDAIVAECSGSGDLLTVTIAVVDRAGAPIMELRADNASPHNWELAFRKAYTARTFRRTTIDVRDRTAGDAPLADQRQLTNVIGLGGGVPIIKDGDGIGGIGVSGAEGGQDGDHACALAGLAAIADDLK
jgi:uncharacterized protein GlcG (DUF336 family)